MTLEGFPIKYDKELSWLIGFWTGDNFSSREGTVIRNGKRASGRFGINSNDTEIVKRAIEVMKIRLKQKKIRILVQIPQKCKVSKSKLCSQTSKIFNINETMISVYRGSKWRRKIGYAAYVNNTELQRRFYIIYNSLQNLVEKETIKIRDFLQGIADAEGDVNKVSRLITLSTKDKYVLNMIKTGLEKMKLDYSISKTKRDLYRVYIKDLKKFSGEIQFYCRRKQLNVDEILKGNLMRTKDLEYMKLFMPYLKNGTTVRKLQEKTNLPYSTIGIVLRNLRSGGVLRCQKIGRKNSGFTYFYTTI